ncbi:MAG: heme NO-binding domain-containing protein [Candidatus Nanopelagicales bacterium]
MKGILFNLVEQIVTEDHGADMWDDLLDDAGLFGAYTSIGSYDDAEMMAILDAASQRLDVPVPEVERHLGRRALPLFLERYPELRGDHTTSRGLIMTLNSFIHPQVRILHPGADVPDFDVAEIESDSIEMTYRSGRRLCFFAEGLLLGAGDEYGENIAVSQSTCMHDGADHCVLQVMWESP